MEIKTKCVICDTYDNAKEVYPPQIEFGSIDFKTFSARRLPDQVHYRWVRCNLCKLMRSDPIYDLNLLELYKESTFEYSQETENLKKTYFRLAKYAIKDSFFEKSILEIGGGNGFFLEEMISAKAKSIAGVEPSKSAIDKSAPNVKPYMICDQMRNGLFPSNYFDLVAMFHVMDHLSDPLKVIEAIYEVLKPGGKILIAIHNEKSISSKILRRKSPIVDVEHTYLYNFDTARLVILKSGLINVQTGWYANTYSIRYLFQLLPLPISLKKALLSSRFLKIIMTLRVSFPLGNMWLVAEKPRYS
jgi:SAM-dependent methyltransferase